MGRCVPKSMFSNSFEWKTITPAKTMLMLSMMPLSVLHRNVKLAEFSVIQCEGPTLSKMFVFHSVVGMRIFERTDFSGRAVKCDRGIIFESFAVFFISTLE